MSIAPPTFCKVIPNVTNFKDKLYGIKLGYDSRQQYQVSIDSPNTGGINMNINLDGGKQVLIPEIYVVLTGTVKLTAVSDVSNGSSAITAGKLLTQGIGFKPLPFNHAIEDCTITLSGESFSSKPSELSRIMLKTMSKQDLASISSNYIYDQTAEVVRGYNDSLSNIKSTPGILESEETGGSMTNDIETGGVAFAKTYTRDCAFTLREKLCAVPFNMDSTIESGFIGQSRMNIQLTFNNMVNRMFAITAPVTVAETVAVTSVSLTKLIFEYSTVMPNDVVPVAFDQIDYDLPEYQHEFSTVACSSTAIPAGAVSAGTAADTTSITYTSMPSVTTQLYNLRENLKAIYIWATPNATTEAKNNDFFYSIKSLSINFRGRTFLASCDQYQLWQIYKENGGTMPFGKWYGKSFIELADIGGATPAGSTATNAKYSATTGLASSDCYRRFLSAGPLILKPETNLPSDSFTSVSANRATFQATLQFQNNSNAAVTGYTYHIVFQYNNRLSWIRNEQKFIRDTNIVAADNVVNSTDAPTIYDEGTMLGGNIFKDSYTWIKNKAIPWIKTAAPKARDIMGRVESIIPGSSAITAPIKSAMSAVGLGKRGGTITTGGGMDYF